MPDSMDDRRLKLIEVVLTLGGFLGVIVTLENSQLVAPFDNLFIFLIIMFIVSAFLAYSGIEIPIREKGIQFELALFSVSFSGLLTVALSIPLSSAALGAAILSKATFGVTGADVIYVVTFLGILTIFYYMMNRVMSFSFENMKGKGDSANMTRPPDAQAKRPKVKGRSIDLNQLRGLKALHLGLMIGGAIILLFGVIYLTRISEQEGIGIIAAGVGFAALGLGFLSHDALEELRQSQVDEKIAMIYIQVKKGPQRVVADLEALERIAGSATKQQVEHIEDEANALVAELERSPTEAAKAREILVRILAKHGKSLDPVINADEDKPTGVVEKT
jgi:hypothetical protein